MFIYVQLMSELCSHHVCAMSSMGKWSPNLHKERNKGEIEDGEEETSDYTSK